MIWQQPEPFIVTVAREPTPELTLADVILGSLGLVGVMLLAAMLLGGVVALLLVRRHRRHPPEHDHLPPVSPLIPDPTRPPAAPGS